MSTSQNSENKTGIQDIFNIDHHLRNEDYARFLDRINAAELFESVHQPCRLGIHINTPCPSAFHPYSSVLRQENEDVPSPEMCNIAASITSSLNLVPSFIVVIPDVTGIPRHPESLNGVGPILFTKYAPLEPLPQPAADLPDPLPNPPRRPNCFTLVPTTENVGNPNPTIRNAMFFVQMLSPTETEQGFIIIFKCPIDSNIEDCVVLSEKLVEMF